MSSGPAAGSVGALPVLVTWHETLAGYKAESIDPGQHHVGGCLPCRAVISASAVVPERMASRPGHLVLLRIETVPNFGR